MKSNQLRKKLYGCQWTNDVQFIINHQTVYDVYPMTLTTTKDLVFNLVESNILFDTQFLIYILQFNKFLIEFIFSICMYVFETISFKFIKPKANEFLTPFF